MDLGLHLVGRSTLIALFLICVCAPSLWLGVAWGLDSVRQPRKAWHRRMRWSWVACFGIAGGLVLTPFAAVVIFSLAERGPTDSFTDGLAEIAVLTLPPVVLLAIVPAVGVAMIARSLARRSGRWCLRCGYDLRLTAAEACPECGEAIPRGSALDSGIIRNNARTRWWRAVRRGALALAALAVVVGACVAIYDTAIAAPRPGRVVICDMCGAIEESSHSPWLHLPARGRRLHSFPGSATCTHRWSAGLSPRQPAPALCEVDSGDVLVFQKPQEGATEMQPAHEAPMIYGALQMPVKPGGLFTLRWRTGPGSLDAPDAKLARIELRPISWAQATYGQRTTLQLVGVRCEPEELRGECAMVLGMHGKTIMYVVRDTAMDSGHVRSASPDGPLCMPLGTGFVPRRSTWPRIKFRRIPAAEWAEFGRTQAPWPGLVSDFWEGFEAPADAPASPTDAPTS